MNTIVVYDIETLSNLFLYYDYNPKTEDDHVFIFHESRNDLKEFIEYLKTKGLNQVGFNNINFDAQVLQWILDNEYKLSKLSGDALAKEVYQYSQYVISKQNGGGWPDYPEWKLKIPQLDLFKIWHFDNKAKATGLKWIQFSMDWDNLLEMPIEHTETVSTTQIPDILEYCKNDVLSTSQFFKITLGQTDHPLYKGSNRIELRNDIEKEFGVRCINFNDVKIGDEINKQSYLSLTGIDKDDLKIKRAPTNSFMYKDCVPNYISFITSELNEFYDKLKSTIVDINIKQEFILNFKGTSYTIAKGGIHSNDTKRILKPNENQILRDADVQSMYPNSIRKRRLYPRHLGEEWLEIYISNIYKRINAKKDYKLTKNKKSKVIDEVFKLSLNGAFGKTGEPSSWQYDLFINMSVTIGNQLEILMLIEMLELKNIHVLSANTDGIVCLFEKEQEDTYNKICMAWEMLVGNHELGQLEYTDYEKLAQTSVNSYIAIKTGTEPIEDRVKTKNEFMTDFELHKNKSARVVPLALYEYFVHGRSPKDFIMNHKNIYDFCIGVKKKGDTYFMTERVENNVHIEEKQQKTLRFYISNKGCKITKRHKDGRLWQITAGKWMHTLFNKFEKKPWNEYDINYSYYIEKAQSIIDSINDVGKNETHEVKQLELF